MGVDLNLCGLTYDGPARSDKVSLASD